jgi:hypothetical protein
VRSGDRVEVEVIRDPTPVGFERIAQQHDPPLRFSEILHVERDVQSCCAARKDCVTCVDVLAAAGADLNAADGQGRTAAHRAALWGLTDVIPVPAQEQGGPDP